MDADRIIVLNDGKLDAFDTHDNLLKSNAIYRDVYDSQTNGGGDFDEGGAN
jgi:ATP-binding cassette subfamily B protein